MKKNKKKDEFLEQLKGIPIVTVAAEKVSVSRNSIYRWRKEDKDFHNAMEEAIQEGEELINDLSESQLLAMIKEKNWPAIRFWLSHRNPKFRDQVEVTAKIEESGEMTPSQEKVVRRALQLATVIQNKNSNYENKSPKSNTGGPVQENDSGQNSEDSTD